MKGTMCGLVKEAAAPGKFVYRTDLPIPQIGDDEVLIKNVHDRKVGDRVSCETHVPCGTCWFCKNGLSHICRNVKLFGVTEDGAFAEYAKIRADSTFLLDDDIAYETACLFEPMGAGVHGVESADVAGKTVLVSGCGPIGLTAVSACKTFGAKLVIADGVGVDAAIDITGAGPAINASLRSVRAAGKLVCVGLPTKNVEMDMANDLIYREVEVTGVSGRKIWETWTDFAKVMKGPYYNLDKVMGNRFALKDFEQAIAQIESGIPGKMILYP